MADEIHKSKRFLLRLTKKNHSAFLLILISIDLDIKFFWKWTDFQSYLNFILIFGLVCGALMYLFLDVPIFVEVVGLLAVLTEAMLGVPQFIRNCGNKSTEGMRFVSFYHLTSFSSR